MRRHPVCDQPAFQLNFQHQATVKQVIGLKQGLKQGLDGTAFVPYLRRAFKIVLFPELWYFRTVLQWDGSSYGVRWAQDRLEILSGPEL